MLKSLEIKKYIDNAMEIYSNGSCKIIGYVIKRSDGSSRIRLHVYDKIENLSSPIEIQLSKINVEVGKLCDYMRLDRYRDIRKIRETIEACLPSMPVIRSYRNIGYQRDMDGEIVSYNGARCFDSKGKDLIKDMCASLPRYDGGVQEVVAVLNPYMQKNVKRQIVLLHALSGAVCGLVRRNSILVLVGESSRGKTTAMKMGASFFAQPDCEKTVLKWSATQNALVKRMDGLSGVNVLIDDTQLSKMKGFQNIIYSFEGGESYDRLEKGSRLSEKCHWNVSFAITAERSLVDTFQDKGAVGRIIEMTVRGNDLFDSMDEVGSIQKLYQKNYGLVGTEFIQKLMGSHGENEIRQMVEEEGKEAVRKHSSEINGDTVLVRHLEGDIAIMTVTARLANKYLGFEFDIQAVQLSLMEQCAENRRTFDQNKLDEQNIKTIYQSILASGQERHPQYEKDGRIIIPSKLMKECLTGYVAKFKVKAARIKEELALHGYLMERNGTYCWNHTIDKISVSGYELIIKGEEA